MAAWPDFRLDALPRKFCLAPEHTSVFARVHGPVPMRMGTDGDAASRQPTHLVPGEKPLAAVIALFRSPTQRSRHGLHTFPRRFGRQEVDRLDDPFRCR